MANIITGIRILCSIVLLFFPAFSPAFYALYLTAGITDMIDGTVARKTDTVSEFGSKLDTAADFIFVAVCLMKLLPVLNVPAWIQVWTGIIAVIKIINLVYGFVVQKRFVTEHTLINKLTGLMIFVLPLTLFIMELKYSAAVVCVVATFSAIQEGYYIRIGRIKE